MSATPATRAASATELYGNGLLGDAPVLWARRRDGSGTPLPLRRWLGRVEEADEAVLARAAAPVLDVGCGPGRHVAALARRDVPALGIDISAVAVAHAVARGAAAIEADVFGRVPGAGAWGSALLLDGNVGIGGCPRTLLRRVAKLLAPGGTVLVELEPPGVAGVAEELRLEVAGEASDWFAWARVGVDELEALARSAGLEADTPWEHSGRWFAALVAP